MDIFTKVIDAAPKESHLTLLLLLAAFWASYFFWRNHFSGAANLQTKRQALDFLKALEEIDKIEGEHFQQTSEQLRGEALQVLRNTNGRFFKLPVLKTPKFIKTLRWGNISIAVSTGFIVSACFWLWVLSRIPGPTTVDTINAVLIYGGIGTIGATLFVVLWATVSWTGKMETFVLSALTTLSFSFFFVSVLGPVAQVLQKILKAYST